MELLEFSLMAFGTLMVIVDPIATVPAFLAMTADELMARGMSEEEAWRGPVPLPPPEREIMLERTSCILARHGCSYQAKLGDRVTVEFSVYDLNRGRIIYRFK